MSSSTGCTLRERRWRSSSDERVTATIDILTRWELSGAIWRVQSISDAEAVVELCTCFGEPVDRIESEDPDLIAYLWDRPT